MIRPPVNFWDLLISFAHLSHLWNPFSWRDGWEAPGTCSALGGLGGCVYLDVQYVLVAILVFGWVERLSVLLAVWRWHRRSCGVLVPARSTDPQVGVGKPTTETGSRARWHFQRLSPSNLLLPAGPYLLKCPQTVPRTRENVFKMCLWRTLQIPTTAVFFAR